MDHITEIELQLDAIITFWYAHEDDLDTLITMLGGYGSQNSYHTIVTADHPATYQYQMKMMLQYLESFYAKDLPKMGALISTLPDSEYKTKMIKRVKITLIHLEKMFIEMFWGGIRPMRTHFNVICRDIYTFRLLWANMKDGI